MAGTDFVWSTVGEQASGGGGVKMMAYGESGVGKTVLAATLPTPFIMVSTENGLLSMGRKNLIRIFMDMGMDEQSATTRADAAIACPVMIVRNGIQLMKAFNWLSDPKNSHLFKAVAWDSASDTAEVMLEAAKSSNADGRKAYGEVADIIGKYFRKFRDELAGKHVYIAAKKGSMQDGVSGAIFGGPDFPGKQLGPQSPYWLDEVFRIGVAINPANQLPYRYLQTQPNDQYTAKDRSGVLDLWEKPDLSYIIDKITNGKNLS